jgi:hypothetical protein
MHRFRPKQNARAEAGYATRSDFCENLINDLQPLYLLAFLLTGTHAEAEQCFVATIEDAVRANGVFRGWERSWSKRCLIVNAIRSVGPGLTESAEKQQTQRELEVRSRGPRSVSPVTGLAPPLQRFVFVMSVLERYSEHDCALLLGRTPRDVAEARIHALWQLSGFNADIEKTAG